MNVQPHLKNAQVRVKVVPTIQERIVVIALVLDKYLVMMEQNVTVCIILLSKNALTYINIINIWGSILSRPNSTCPPCPIIWSYLTGKNANPLFGNVIHAVDLRNSVLRILPESMDFPDLFHSIELYNYYEKSKSVLFSVKVHTICMLSIFNQLYLNFALT